MDSELINTLKSLNISDEKIVELNKKPMIVENIKIVSKNGLNKLQYTLACTAPKGTNIEILSELILENKIKHECILRGLFKLKNQTKEICENFIKENDLSEEELIKIVDEKKEQNLEKNVILREMKKIAPFSNFKIIMDSLENYKPEQNLENNKLEQKEIKSEIENSIISNNDFKWLEEGEVSRLNKPEENKQKTEEILKAHLSRTGGKVVTRFPPEPSGCLHIGHAKALNLSFEFARKFGGKTYLRFDDTNPRNEKAEHFESIQEDIKWLGFEPCEVTASSDHFEKMMEFSKKLIRNGKAYVCELDNEEVKNRRQLFQKERDELLSKNIKVDYFKLGTILSPYRNFSEEDNLIKFEKMLNGEYLEGAATLRFKMPLESKNPLMLDLVGARVIDMVHPFKNKNYMVYPSYEFALCVCDSLEDVTHSFCSREFYTRQEPYHWLLKELDLYEPVQWEFSRLNLSNAILSKRKFNELVKKGLGWDDPRFYTISGMRRRGFPAKAINKFAQSVGITFSETIVDVKILESFVSKELFKTAKKINCILNPLKINLNIKKNIKLDESTEVNINKVLYIDRSDYSEKPDSNFLRLTSENPVGLIGANGSIKYISTVFKSDGEIDCLNCEFIEESDKEKYKKPKKFIQWIANLDCPVELRMYSPLFKSFNPEEVGYLNDIDLEGSLKIKTGYCDSRILTAKVEDKYQFLRIGYFCCDKDSFTNSEKKLIFNLTIELKSNY